MSGEVGEPGRVRRRWAVPAAAGVVTLLSRVPFAAERLWDHDSVQFALAVADFDLAAHQPHPPGYPLWIGALKLLAAAGVSPLDGMVALAALFQALGAALVVRVAARLAGEREGAAEAAPAGLLAAALFMTNPLVWFYGELPLVYGAEAGLTVLLAWAALGMADGRRRFLAACALFGLAGGIRPSTLVLLSPLFLAGLGRAWRRGRAGAAGGESRGQAAVADGLLAGEGGAGGAAGDPPARADGPRGDREDGGLLTGEGGAGEGDRRAGARTARWRLGFGDLALGAVVGALAVAAWLVPLVVAAGGWGAYRRIGGEHFAALLPHTSILYGAGWPALAHNLEVLTKWAVQGLVPAGAVLLALAAARPRAVVPGLRLLARRTGWIAVWALPAAAFFALFHVTKAGYTLIHLPAFLVAAALAAAPALAGSRGRRAAATLAAVAVGSGLFLFGADRRPDQPRWLAAVRHEHNAGEIAAAERDLDAVLAVLGGLPAGRVFLATVELSGTGAAGAEGFLYPYHRHLQWYAPDRPVALLVPEQSFALVSPGGRQDFRRAGPEIELPPGIDRVVFVLAGLPGPRLRLPPAEVLLSNERYVVLAAPLGEGIEVGPLVLRAAGSAEEAVAGG